MSSLLCRSVFVKEFHTIRVFLNIRWLLGSNINSNHLWMNVRFLRNWLSGAFSKAGQMFAVGWVIMTELRWLDLFFCWFFWMIQCLYDSLRLNRKVDPPNSKLWWFCFRTVQSSLKLRRLLPAPPRILHTKFPAQKVSELLESGIIGIQLNLDTTLIHDGASNRCSSDFLMYIYYIYFSFNK